MESKADRALTGISRWANPWPAEVSNTHANPHSSYECEELVSPRDSDRSNAEKELPKDSRRRLQTIGFAATGLAATVWLVGIVWAWQVI